MKKGTFGKSAKEIAREDVENRFYKEYLNNGGNITKAMLSVNPELTDKQAIERGRYILKKSDVRKRLMDTTRMRKKRAILSVEDRRQWLSDNVVDEEEKLIFSDRLKALKELNRMDGIGQSNTSINIGTMNNLTIDEKRVLARKSINEVLGIEDEYIDVEVEESEE